MGRSRASGDGAGGESAGQRRLSLPDVGGSSRHQLLLEAVHFHALPRLFAAHGGIMTEPRAQRIGAADIDNLLACVSTPDFHLAEAALAAVASRGFTRAELLVELLTPVARTLHERWRQDRETFAAVALATGRLQRLLRSAAMPAPAASHVPSAGIVLVSGQSDDPRPFEAAVVADFFRSAHWDTECLTPRSEQELSSRLRARAFDLLVLAFGPDARLDPEDHLVPRLRQASVNRGLIVLLTGPQADGATGLAWGADGTAMDAAGAIDAARNLLMSRVA